MRTFFIFLISLWLPLHALAYERIENVYEAVVPIDDRTDRSRNQAIREGLKQVLVRYSGYSNITSLYGVSAELNSAQRYVIEYGVETIEVESVDGLGKEEGDALWVRFNAGLIDQLAHRLELPIWPTLRPSLSYSVVTELWGEPHIPTPEEYPAIFLHLERFFSERGLNASLVSKGKLAVIGASSLWNIDEATSRELRATTDDDISLLIRVRPRGNGVQALDFLFMEEQAETLIRQPEGELVANLDAGINQYMDQLSAGLAFLGGAKGELDLYVQIMGMRAYSEYKKVLSQIAGLEQVLSVRMENATDQGIGYLIRYQSDLSLLIESIIAITGIQPMDILEPEIATEQPENVSETRVAPIRFYFPGSTFMRQPGMEQTEPDYGRRAPFQYDSTRG